MFKVLKHGMFINEGDIPCLLKTNSSFIIFANAEVNV
jgi:hypothetical protein